MTDLKRIGLNWLVGLPIAGGMVAWALLAPTLPLWLEVALWAGAVLLVGYLFYRSSAWLFGPVLFYELIRGARSPRVPVLRGLYALVLLLALFLVYLGFAAGSGSERSLRALFEGVIQLTVRAIDEKSQYTGDHCRNVPILTELIADAACAANEGPLKGFSLSPDQRYELRIAALLHDCGKVATPARRCSLGVPNLEASIPSACFTSMRSRAST